MASEQAPGQHAPDIFAVAFVVDSSLVVANEWLRIILDYISPMLRRLSEANPGCKPRMAFVTYATADTLPSPILCKRFFIDYLPVTKEMKDAPTKLGIGSTNPGGTRGMAALDGLVAAIEFFDILHTITPQARLSPGYIFHVASTSPDAALHPQCNDSPLLDFVTWEAMPTEFKKRNINFSTINIRPNLTRFSDLHSAVAPGAPKEPWFPTRSPHSVLLGGFPMSPQKAMKRAGDVHTTPDPKRARLAHTAVDVSPKLETPKTPLKQSKPSPLLPPQVKVQPLVQPSSQGIAQPPAQLPVAQVPAAQVPGNGGTNPTPSSYDLSTVVMAAKTLDDQMRVVTLSLQNAKASGNGPLVETLQDDLAMKRVLSEKLKAAFITMSKNNASSQTPAQSQIQDQNAIQSQGLPIPGPSMPKTLPEAAHPPSQPEARLDPQALAAQLGHKRTASGSGSVPGMTQPRPPMPPTQNAAMVAQIQKMEQQRARAMQPSQNMAGPSNMDVKSNMPIQQPQAGPSSDPRITGKGPSPIWQGTISYSGTDQLGNKKETTVWVVASTPNVAESRVETWPASMSLVPAREPSVPLPDLQAWIKRQGPALCTFAPQKHSNIADPQGNETNYKNLATLLLNRNAYAVAAWTRPSGEQGNNILFFPVSSGSLAGACFPVTGILEMPRSSQLMPNLLGLDPNNPEFRARMSAMTPEQREQFMKHVQQQKVLHMQRQAMMAQGVGGPGNNPGTNNALAMNAMNMASHNPSQSQQQHADMAFGGNVHPSGNYGGMGMMNTMGIGQQQAMMAAGMPRPPNNGMRNPIPPNINYEMLQSFMQRNLDSGGASMGQ
ncbi:hypothetical protein FPV67DRAFT_1486597 [Lyophyllum atratum]|nr:hypothetical protein FPV67DRAFT_1486597 [Lyophyllum atratum]